MFVFIAIVDMGYILMVSLLNWIVPQQFELKKNIYNGSRLHRLGEGYSFISDLSKNIDSYRLISFFVSLLNFAEIETIDSMIQCAARSNKSLNHLNSFPPMIRQMKRYIVDVTRDHHGIIVEIQRLGSGREKATHLNLKLGIVDRTVSLKKPSP